MPTISHIDVTAPAGKTTWLGCAYAWQGNIYIADTTSIYRYNVSTQTYTLVYNFPSTVYNKSAFYNGKFYIIKTMPGSSLVISTYDLATNQYVDKYKTISAFSSTGSSASSAFMCMTVVGSKFSLSWAGSYYGDYVRIALIYDMNTDRYSVTSTSYERDWAKNTQQVFSTVPYITTRATYRSGARYYNEDTYKLANDLLSATNLTPKWNYYDYCCMHELHGKIYIIGGRYASSFATDTTLPPAHPYIDVYDPDLNQMTREAYAIPPSSNTTSSHLTAAVLDDRIYIFYFDRIYILEDRIYTNVYSVKSNDGETTYLELTGQAPLEAVNFSNVAGSSTVNYTFRQLGVDHTGQFSIDIPEGESLRGFALTPNASTPIIPVNSTVTFVRDEDITFYPVFGSYRPPATTFDINLYQNAAEPTRVDKSSFLTSVGTLSGALREECSIKNPSILIERTTLPAFNYVYIAIFGRYYFVDGITSVRYGLWRIELKVDPLMSWKTGIGGLSAVIGRQEFSYNADLVDSELPVEKEQTVEVTEIANSSFSTATTGADHYNYVLVVVGR